MNVHAKFQMRYGKDAQFCATNNARGPINIHWFPCNQREICTLKNTKVLGNK